MKKPVIEYVGRWRRRHGEMKNQTAHVRIVRTLQDKLILEMETGKDAMEQPLWTSAHLGEFEYEDVMETLVELKHQVQRLETDLENSEIDRNRSRDSL